MYLLIKGNTVFAKESHKGLLPITFTVKEIEVKARMATDGYTGTKILYQIEDIEFSGQPVGNLTTSYGSNWKPEDIKEDALSTIISYAIRGKYKQYGFELYKTID